MMESTTIPAVMLTDAEAAQVCKVSAVTIRRWRKTAGLPNVKIGNTVRIPSDRLREWANAKAISVESK